MNNLCNEQRWIGNLGRDPEFKELSTGTKRATFSIAVDMRDRDENGNWVKAKPQWVEITAYGKLAELVKKLLAKGARILAVTFYRTNRRETDAGMRTYHNFILTNFEVLRWPDRERVESFDDDYDTGFDYEDEDEDLPF